MFCVVNIVAQNTGFDKQRYKFNIFFNKVAKSHSIQEKALGKFIYSKHHQLLPLPW
jgi:hypothetical protein